MKQPVKVNLHPITIREIKKGHPWVTKDKFSEKFPKKEFLLIGKDERKQDLCLLINDPDHPKIKARVWSLEQRELNEAANFKSTLEKRLRTAFEKRSVDQILDERDNLYLVFGEADGLPGLMIQKLKNHLLIQYYAKFWPKMEAELIKALLKATTGSSLLEKHYLWIQERGNPKAAPFRLHGKVNSDHIETGVKLQEIPEDVELKEFGLNYLISFKRNYDLGIYTDMASIRKKLAEYFPKDMKLLNLFAYTGAFSLFGLKQGAETVTSVDLSSKYMQWLEKNIQHNPDLDAGKHRSLIQPAKKALLQLGNQGERFNFIICDPPSASTDKQKTTSALQEYKETLPLMLQLTEPGGYLLLFLNTHQISLAKFRGQIQSILKTGGRDKQVKEIRTFGLSEDCPRLKGFKEGDYLKGILLKVK